MRTGASTWKPLGASAAPVQAPWRRPEVRSGPVRGRGRGVRRRCAAVSRPSGTGRSRRFGGWPGAEFLEGQRRGEAQPADAGVGVGQHQLLPARSGVADDHRAGGELPELVWPGQEVTGTLPGLGERFAIRRRLSGRHPPPGVRLDGRADRLALAAAGFANAGLAAAGLVGTLLADTLLA